MYMKIAVIPCVSEDLNDRLFYTIDESNKIVPRNRPMYQMQRIFRERGDELHTVDVFNDLKEIDFFLLFELNWTWLKEISRIGKADKVIYCNGEPPVVTRINAPKGYKFLSRFVPYILSWNKEWVNNKTVFKRNIPYYFSNNLGSVPFGERKLVTGISGNKTSKHPKELYSEREKVYKYFEQNYPDCFDFYGTGWSKKDHPCYGGEIDCKSDIYHNYRFAICFENMKDINDYVTEKIWDCLTSGIVPIYAGAKNIQDYIPKECYIDYFEFNNCEELASYLLNVDEREYQRYLVEAQRLLNTNIKEEFSGRKYADCIYYVMQQEKNFKITIIQEAYIEFQVLKKNVINQMKLSVKKCLKILRN